MKKIVLTVVAVSCLVAVFYAQNITITPHTSFLRATVGTQFGHLENVSLNDEGGILTFFVENNGSQADSISSLEFWANDSLYEPLGYYRWPLEMKAANQGVNVSAVTVKGTGYPFREGDTVLLKVFTTRGDSAHQVYVVKHPPLRIANVLPGRDGKSQYIYLRNDDDVSATIGGFYLNGKTYSAGVAPQLSAIDGSYTIPAKAMRIFKIQLSDPFPQLHPLCIAVNRTDGNYTQSTSAFLRHFEADFPIGTWNSSLYNAGGSEEGRKRIRSYTINSVFGPGNANLMQQQFNNYSFRTVWEPSFDSAGIFTPSRGAQTVLNNRNKNYIHFWSCDDEPDLNGKDEKEQVIKNMTYWKNDPGRPSYVNLCTQKKYSRYGFYADVVSMDHYCDDGAPNVLPLSWIPGGGRKGSVEEAIEYTWVLKQNTEPRRMLSWSQLAAGVWSSQAEDFILNYQFWAHVMSGAKGIHFFVAQTGTAQSFPLQWAEGLKMVRHIKPLANLCLYGESMDVVETNTQKVKSRALIGENAMVIVLLNNSIDYIHSGGFNLQWTPSIDVQPFEVEFDVPQWIALEQFYEQTPVGKMPIPGLTDLGNRRYKIAGNIHKDSRVFVFGINDIVAPEKPDNISFPDRKSEHDYTISWREPYDNFGVKGYIVKAEGNVIDTVYAPLIDVSGGPSLCGNGSIEIIAFDEAGNQSQPAIAPAVTPGNGTPLINSQPIDATVNAGSNTFFEVGTAGATHLNCQWQVDTGTGVWTNLQNSHRYKNVNLPRLQIIYATQIENGYRYRCLVNESCFAPNDTSTPALLTVIGEVNLNTHYQERVDVKVYPNPGNEKWIVEVPDERVKHLQVFDMTGKKITATILHDGNDSFIVDVSRFAAGLYHILLMDKSSVELGRSSASVVR